MKITRNRFLAVYNAMIAMSENLNREVGWFSSRNVRKMKETVMEINIASQPSQAFVDFMTKAKQIAIDCCVIDDKNMFVLNDGKYTFESEAKKDEYIKRQKDLEEENTEVIAKYEAESKTYLEEEIDYEPYTIEYKHMPVEFSGKAFELLEGFITE